MIEVSEDIIFKRLHKQQDLLVLFIVFEWSIILESAVDN